MLSKLANGCSSMSQTCNHYKESALQISVCCKLYIYIYIYMHTHIQTKKCSLVSEMMTMLHKYISEVSVYTHISS